MIREGKILLRDYNEGIVSKRKLLGYFSQKEEEINRNNTVAQ